MRVLFSSITFQVLWYGCQSSFASTDLLRLQAQHDTMLSLWVSYRDIALSANTSAAFQHSCTQAGPLYGTNPLDICCELQHHLPFPHLDSWGVCQNWLLMAITWDAKKSVFSLQYKITLGAWCHWKALFSYKERHFYVFPPLQMLLDSNSEPTVLLEEKWYVRDCDNMWGLKINEGFKEFFSCMWKIQ